MSRLVLNLMELSFAIFCITTLSYTLGKFNSKPSVYNDSE